MRNKIIIVALLIALVGIGVWYFGVNQNQGAENNDETVTTAPTEDVMEVVMDFYQPWLEAAQSTTTDPWQAELYNDPILSDEVREMIQVAQTGSEQERDPVLCQSTIPERIGSKIVYEQERAAEIAVLARTGAERSQEQAAVTVTAQDGRWQITAINCLSGESGPEREFTFEQEGYLLKDSLPDTMDTQYWHLVYEQRGQSGYTVPLFFDEASVCIDVDGGETVCDPNTLQEVARVFVQGQMLEAGLELKRLHFMPAE